MTTLQLAAWEKCADVRKEDIKLVVVKEERAVGGKKMTVGCSPVRKMPRGRNKVLVNSRLFSVRYAEIVLYKCFHTDPAVPLGSMFVMYVINGTGTNSLFSLGWCSCLSEILFTTLK